MQRFLKLKCDNIVLTTNKEIEQYLANSDFYWLLECEVDNVDIEINTKLNVLIWNNGIFYWGDWQWGHFKNGEFKSGNWHGGIYSADENKFKGNWIRGVKKYE